LTAERVIRTLDRVIECYGKPRVLRYDNGPAYVSALVIAQATKHGIRLDYSQPGQPQQNAYVARFNRTVRYEWLAPRLFASIVEGQFCSTACLWTYNHERPNMALGDITPNQRLTMAA
jgi:putative transposase